MLSRPWLLPLLLLIGCNGQDDTGDLPPSGLPDSLPFAFERPADGQAPSEAEIDAFTAAITGFWRDVDVFRWCTWHAHGLHASYDPDMPAYALWWQDTRAVKAGSVVTFEHHGGADNIMIRTPKVLTQAAYGWRHAGDPAMRELLVGYSRGVSALFQGMVWADDLEPTESIAARAIFTHDHVYTTGDGRSVAVDYAPVRVERYDWNAHTVPNPANPTFGSIWVRNMRSKDDPHMYRVAPVLMRIVEESDDQEVTDAAQGALDHLVAFADDIAAHDWKIRSKEDGQVFVPDEDLASLNDYVSLDPESECTARLATALLAGVAFEEDCGDGIAETWEDLSTVIHYYNRAIHRYFHLSALTLALALREDVLALELLEGLATRADGIVDNDEGRANHDEWDADAASYLLAAAASGLPLTGREARLIQERYTASAEHYSAWEHWDLWDPSVPDGTYDYLPSRKAVETEHVRMEEMTYLIEACASPWRNPASVEVVDCEVVLDPARWGE